jgi:hypothetical protein
METNVLLWGEKSSKSQPKKRQKLPLFGANIAALVQGGALLYL